MDTLKLPFSYILGQRFLIQLKSGVTKTVFFDQFGLLREEGGSDSLNIHTNDIVNVLDLPDNLRVSQPAMTKVSHTTIISNIYYTVEKQTASDSEPTASILQKFAEDETGAYYDPDHPLRSFIQKYAARGALWLLALLCGLLVKHHWAKIKKRFRKIIKKRHNR